MKNIFINTINNLKNFFYDFSVKVKKKKTNQSNIATQKRNKIIFLLIMFLYPTIQFVIFWLIPNLNSFVLAFSKYNRVNKETIFSLYQFKRVFEFLADDKSLLSISLKNSLAYFIVINIIGLPLTLILSYFIFKKIVGYKIFRVVFFLPSIISGVVLSTLFKNFLNPINGPINMLLSKIMNVPIQMVPNFLGDPKYKLWTISIYTLWTGFGVNMVMLSSAINRLPEEIIEYGKIEGVGMTRELLFLIVPMISPTLTTIFTLGIAGYFTFLQPVMLLDPIGSSGLSSATSVGYYIYYLFKGKSVVQFEFSSAVGVLCGVVGVPIIMFVKHLTTKINSSVEY